MTRLLTAAPLVLVAVGGLSATVDPEDQAVADAAVAVFNERLTAAGWTSTGPFTQAAPEGGDDEESEFGSCLGGFERYLDYTDVRFPGETARAFSDNFELESSDPEGTDALGGTFGYSGAVVLTAEESAVDVLDTFVEQLGAEGTVACMTEQEVLASAPEEVTVSNEDDLGVGDASARLDLAVAMSYDGQEFSSAATFAAARVDRSLVVVVVGGTGGGAGDLDPVAELAAVVDSFG